MEKHRWPLVLFACTAILAVAASGLYSLLAHDVRPHCVGTMSVHSASPSLHHGVWIRFEAREETEITGHAVWYLIPWRDVVTEL